MPSGDRKKTLVLSPETPYPLAGGGAMRTASLLEFLSTRSRLHLILFAEEGQSDPAEGLPTRLAERVTTIRLPRHRRDLGARLARNVSRALRGRPPLLDRFSEPQCMEQFARAVRGERYALAVAEHFWCAPYLSALREVASRVVLDLHNVESVLHGRCARSEPWFQSLGHRLFAHHAHNWERRLLPGFDLVLTPSVEDGRQVAAIAASSSTAVYPNAVPLRDQPDSPEEDSIAFSGNLSYHPNVTAVRHFNSLIWPALREKRPGLKWRVIGKNEEQVRRLVGGQPDIEVTGPVDDALLELAKSKLAVVPLLAGSGTRVKIMEAWAAGRPVVSTRLGAEGLPARDGENLILAESPSEWIERIVELLDDAALRKRIGGAGRRTYEDSCCWPAAWRCLEEHLQPLMGGAALARAH